MAKHKILLIRMQDSQDAIPIALAAYRHFAKRFPEASVQLLSYGGAQKILQAVAPEVDLFIPEKVDWPEMMLPAIEHFVGLAGEVIGGEFDQIVNLDTAFMPCLMARFLKDAGEPVVGNCISMPIQKLLQVFAAQTLEPEYVNQTENYLQSSFMGMSRWRQRWWEFGTTPDGGYGEYYLRHCCGFSELDYNLQLNAEAEPKLQQMRGQKTMVAMALSSEDEALKRIQSKKWRRQLQQKGYEVWLWQEDEAQLQQQVKKLAASYVLISSPHISFWLAKALGCKTILLSGKVEPVAWMPDLATEPNSTPDIHEIIEGLSELEASTA